MKQTILIVTLLCATMLIHAQSITRSVVSAYGLSGSNTSAQLDATIGEPMVKTVSNGNNTLTQGFHQTQLVVTTIKENEQVNNYQFYPNPVNEVLNFNTNNNDPVNIALYDATGKLIWSKQNVLGTQQIPFKGRTKGLYLIKVTNIKQQKISTLKILKN